MSRVDAAKFMEAAFACLRDNHLLIAQRNEAYLAGKSPSMAIFAGHARRVDDKTFAVVLTLVAESVDEASRMLRAAGAPYMGDGIGAKIEEVRFDEKEA